MPKSSDQSFRKSVEAVMETCNKLSKSVSVDRPKLLTRPKHIKRLIADIDLTGSDPIEQLEHRFNRDLIHDVI